MCPGLRSYGKVVYVLGPAPILGYLVFATKILGLFPLHSFQDWLTDQDWAAYIYNAKVEQIFLGCINIFAVHYLFFLLQSWVCAAKECFFTWAFLGGSLLQLAAHNKFKHNLRRDR